jgi:hypothetical protein
MSYRGREDEEVSQIDGVKFVSRPTWLARQVQHEESDVAVLPPTSHLGQAPFLELLKVI